MNIWNDSFNSTALVAFNYNLLSVHSLSLSKIGAHREIYLLHWKTLCISLWRLQPSLRTVEFLNRVFIDTIDVFFKLYLFFLKVNGSIISIICTYKFTINKLFSRNKNRCYHSTEQFLRKSCKMRIVLVLVLTVISKAIGSRLVSVSAYILHASSTYWIWKIC